MNKLYKEWLTSRQKFIVPLLVFLIIFYFSLPISLALFPEFIKVTTVFWGLPLIWLYAFLQIIMTLIIAHLYLYKAKKLDELAEKMRNE